MTSPIRLIALDIDGTLLNSFSEVPDVNIRAIEAAIAEGIEVALVTGRRFDFARPVAEKIGEKIPCPLTMIVNNGALVRSKTGETHLRRLLPQPTALEVLRQMSEYKKRAALVFDRPRENQVIYEHIDWDDPRRRPYLLRNREYVAEMSPLENALTEDPIQVMFSGEIEPMRAAESKLRSLAMGPPASPISGAWGKDSSEFSLAVTYYERMNFGMLDVIQFGCSKGATLAEWAKRQGYAREEIMAMGDNFNDLEMLQFAGLPVVMGNAIPELKAMGWRETLSNDDGGVAAAIEKFALGKRGELAQKVEESA
jgi:Cof subfamily protein (haloacid dehalogenase superfamily)